MTNASTRSRSTIQIPRGTAAGWKSSSANARNVTATAKLTPRSTPHMSFVDTYRHQRL